MDRVSDELARVVEYAEPILRAVSDEASLAPVLAGGWSRRQLLGHLIDSASNNHQRFVRAALADALEFPGYDTPGNIAVQDVQAAAWPLLVDLWASYNRYLVHVLRGLPTAKRGVWCRIGSHEPVTLAFLAEDYVRHLAHHLGQIGAAPS